MTLENSGNTQHIIYEQRRARPTKMMQGTSNRTDTNLILNLARNSPWLNDGGKNLFPEVIQGDTRKILGEIRDNRLTIITERGQVYEQHQPLNIINNKIQIEKPFDWRETTESFHFFFQNRHGAWNYFPATNAVSSPSTLQIKTPDKIYHLQKRRYHRVKTPTGTKAIFRGEDNYVESAHVKDLCEGGMRIFNSSVESKYPIGLIIKEIFITIPPDQAIVGRRVTPLISKGEVVSSCYDHQRGISSYGVRFFYDSAYVKEKIHDIVAFIEGLPE